MKKFLTILLLVAILASCTVALAGNVEFLRSATVYKKAGSGKTNTVIESGSVEEKIKMNGKWTQIKYGGKKGWVRTKYVSKSKKDIQIFYSSGGSGKSKETGTEEKASGKVTTTGKTALRSKAALKGEYLKTVKKGTSLTIKAQKKDSRGVYWYKVKYKGKKGWISSVYTDKKKVEKKSNSSPSPAPSAAPSRAPSPSPETSSAPSEDPDYEPSSEPPKSVEPAKTSASVEESWDP